MCKNYLQEGIVCPLKLVPGLFTTSAIDNIDHNPSSTTERGSFHGTLISIFQHPEEHVEKYVLDIDCNADNKSVSNLKLPTSYTDILPTKGGQPKPCALELDMSQFETNPSTLPDASEWMTKLITSDTLLEDRQSFSRLYLKKSSRDHTKAICQLLPLLADSVNTLAMVRHCIKVIIQITQKLCPGQINIITADQPVYALGRGTVAIPNRIQICSLDNGSTTYRNGILSSNR